MLLTEIRFQMLLELVSRVCEMGVAHGLSLAGAFILASVASDQPGTTVTSLVTYNTMPEIVQYVLQYVLL